MEIQLTCKVGKIPAALNYLSSNWLFVVTLDEESYQVLYPIQIIEPES